jgi:outer membrane receptor protein involved in Fe transport
LLLKPLVRLSVLLLVAFLLSGAFAGTTGKIAGKITDKQTGEPLPGVNVVIAGTNIGAATNIQGEFFIINVAPGTYTLKVNLIGYRPVEVKSVVVTIDLTTRLDLNLETETIDVGTITVEAERPLIEKDVTSSRMRISSAEITNSAVSGLVNRVNVNAGNVLGSFRGGRVNTGEVAYLLDGVNMANPLGSTYGIPTGSGTTTELATVIPDEAVSEAEVLTGGFGAEYPSVQSAVINVITKEGGKTYSGKFKTKASPDATLGWNNYFGNRSYDANGHVQTGIVPVFDADGNHVSNTWAKDPMYDKNRRSKVYDMRQSDWSFGGPVPLEKVDIPGEMSFFTSGTYQFSRDYRSLDVWRKSQSVTGRLSYNLSSSKKITISGLSSFSNNVPYMFANSRTISWGQTTYFSGPVFWQDATNGAWSRPTNIPAGQEPYYVSTPEGLDTVYSYTPYGWIVGQGHTTLEADSVFFSQLNSILGLSGAGAFAAYPNGEFPDTAIGGVSVKDAALQAASAVEALGWARTYSNYNMNLNQYRAQSWSNEVSFNFNNNLSPRSYYTLSLSRFYTSKRARTYDPFDGHQLSYDEMHEARFMSPRITTYQGFDFDPMFLGRRYTHDDYQTIIALKGDFTSQVNSRNLLKTGFEYKNYDLYKNETSVASGLNDYNDQYHYKPFQVSAYAQNKLESEGMILTVGLRFDFFNPKAWVPANSEDPLLAQYLDANNSQDMFSPAKRLKGAAPAKIKQQLSPRVGISFPITEMDVLHISYGHYFQLPMYDIFYMNSAYDLRGAFKYIGNPNVHEEKTIAYEVGLEHGFNDYLKLAVTGFYKDIADLADYKKVTFANGVFWVRSNSDYARVKGFEFTLTQRPWHNLSGVVTYTYQIARGRTSANDLNFTNDYFNRKPLTEDFPLDSDQRHTARANVNYRIPNNWGPTIAKYPFLGDWGFDFYWNFGSGTPYTGSTNVQPPNIPPTNNKTFPTSWSIDVRADKGFDIYKTLSTTFFVEVRNITNKANILATNDALRYGLTGYPAGQFGDTNAYSATRRILLGLEMNF